MKAAIIGSRTLTLDNLEDYVLPGTTEIISGGAKGIDESARAFALRSGLPFTEILPDYARFGRRAPLERNLEIIARADYVLAFWDDVSRGTKQVIDACREQGKRVFVIHRDV